MRVAPVQHEGGADLPGDQGEDSHPRPGTDPGPQVSGPWKARPANPHQGSDDEGVQALSHLQGTHAFQIIHWPGLVVPDWL